VARSWRRPDLCYRDLDCRSAHGEGRLPACPNDAHDWGPVPADLHKRFVASLNEPTDASHYRHDDDNHNAYDDHDSDALGNDDAYDDHDSDAPGNDDAHDGHNSDAPGNDGGGDD
jgi:hypothetical protein